MLSVKIEGLDAALEELDHKQVKRAANSATKDAAKHARSMASALIREKFNVKKSDLDKNIIIRRGLAQLSSGGYIAQEVSIAGPPISLSYFNPKQTIAKSQALSVTRGRGLQGKRYKGNQSRTTVEVEKGKRTTVRSTWLAYVRSFAGRYKGGMTKYGDYSVRVLQRRKGGEIVGPKSPSIPSMLDGMRQGNKLQRLMTSINDYLQKRFIHYLDRAKEGQ